MTRKEHKIKTLRNADERDRLHNNPESKARHVANVMRWRKANPEKVKAIEAKWRARIRANTIAHYGGKCVCCCEDNPGFLTMDHINNDGATHRKTGQGRGLWWWAMKHEYPSTMRLLCYNCNCARGHLGYCPHEREDFMSRVGIG